MSHTLLQRWPSRIDSGEAFRVCGGEIVHVLHSTLALAFDNPNHFIES